MWYITLRSVYINVLEKPAVSQTVLKFPACCGAQSFFTVPTCLSLPRATLIQSYLPSVFRTNTMSAFFFFPTHATCRTHLIILHFVTRILFGKTYKLWSSLFRNLLQYPGTSALLSPMSSSEPYSRTISNFSWNDPNFTPIQNNRTSNNSLYFNLYVLRKETTAWKTGRLVGMSVFSCSAFFLKCICYFLGLHPKVLNLPRF
jgi:hypothetical protein